MACALSLELGFIDAESLLEGSHDLVWLFPAIIQVVMAALVAQKLCDVLHCAQGHRREYFRLVAFAEHLLERCSIRNDFGLSTPPLQDGICRSDLVAVRADVDPPEICPDGGNDPSGDGAVQCL